MFSSTQEKPLSGTRYTLDVNVTAIYLVENHPGNKYVSKIIDFGIKESVEFIIFDFLPIKVYWIITSKWGAEKTETEEAILSFLKLPNIKLVSIDKKDIEDAFKLAKEIHQDIFDSIYAMIALKTKSRGIITTDKDFKKICRKLNLEYVNPVPNEVLKKFLSYPQLIAE